MCGRFVREFSTEEVAEHFGCVMPEWELPPSYNVVPSHHVLGVVASGQPQLAVFEWGWQPSWLSASGKRLINARSETLSEKQTFQEAFAHRRCLIVASGFYEWKENRVQRTPYYIHLSQEPMMVFAGLWEFHPTHGKQALATSTIVTVPANPLLKPMHPRMPAILTKEQQNVWIEPKSSVADLQSALRSYDPEAMECYLISEEVNHAGVNHPGLMQPSTLKAPNSDVEQLQLF